MLAARGDVCFDEFRNIFQKLDRNWCTEIPVDCIGYPSTMNLIEYAPNFSSVCYTAFDMSCRRIE